MSCRLIAWFHSYNSGIKQSVSIVCCLSSAYKLTGRGQIALRRGKHANFVCTFSRPADDQQHACDMAIAEYQFHNLALTCNMLKISSTNPVTKLLILTVLASSTNTDLRFHISLWCQHENTSRTIFLHSHSSLEQTPLLRRTENEWREQRQSTTTTRPILPLPQLSPLLGTKFGRCNFISTGYPKVSVTVWTANISAKCHCRKEYF